MTVKFGKLVPWNATKSTMRITYSTYYDFGCMIENDDDVRKEFNVNVPGTYFKNGKGWVDVIIENHLVERFKEWVKTY